MSTILSAGTTSGTAFTVTPDTSGQLVVQTNGSTTALTIDTSQNATFKSVISVGNATPSTSGAGITFPATQSASTDANTLDDYEEGTWTPVLTAAAGTITGQTTYGTYIKIGRQVILNFSAKIDSGTATAIATIGGFPFTSQTSNASGVGIAHEDSVVGTVWDVNVASNSTTASMRDTANANPAANNYRWLGTVSYISAA
jgi:hypothetical protein